MPPALALRSEAGECARQRSHLLSAGAPVLRQKNLAQEKAAPSPCLCRPRPFTALRATSGAPSGGGAAELALFTSFTPLRHPQQARSRSKGILQCPCPPPAVRSSARPKGVGYPFGPLLRSASVDRAHLFRRTYRRSPPCSSTRNNFCPPRPSTLWPSLCCSALMASRVFAPIMPSALPISCPRASN
ncbi:hypothetical protein ABIE13_004996 [Ottowia thiooxydans]|uniref:Uncharacterized protein n=1 Tax=Ottowia thiooxydans TaxID=219182 RepID=A0ABV2QFQ2_9BURK